MNKGSLILGGPENGKWTEYRSLIYQVVVPDSEPISFSASVLAPHLQPQTLFTYRQVPLAGGHTVFIPDSWRGESEGEYIIRALLNLASS